MEVGTESPGSRHLLRGMICVCPAGCSFTLYKKTLLLLFALGNIWPCPVEGWGDAGTGGCSLISPPHPP